MTDTVASNAVRFAQDEGIGSIGDGNETWHSAGNVGSLARMIGIEEYVASGLEFTNHGSGTVTVSSGFGYVLISSVDVQSSTSGDSTYDTTLAHDIPVSLAIPSGVSLSMDNGTNDVYLAYATDGSVTGVDAGAVYFRYGLSVTAPPHPYIHLGTTDPSDSTADTRASDLPVSALRSLTIGGDTAATQPWVDANYNNYTFSESHNDLTNITSSDHHAKYTDSEARGAVGGSTPWGTGDLDDQHYVDFNNKEHGDYDVDGRLYWDLSAGLYLKSSNAAGSQIGGSLLWSSENFTAGNALSASYDGEDEPTLDVASNSIGDAELTNSNVTVAGNTVGLGGSTGVAYTDLSDTGASFPIPASDISDGSGSDLDADTLDGLNRDDFVHETRTERISSGSDDEYYKIATLGQNDVKVRFAADHIEKINSGRTLGWESFIQVDGISHGVYWQRWGDDGSERLHFVLTQDANDDYHLYVNAPSWVEARVEFSTSDPAYYNSYDYDGTALTSTDLTGSVVYDSSNNTPNLPVEFGPLQQQGNSVLDASDIPFSLGNDTDTDLAGTDLSDGATTIWDATNGYIPEAVLENNAVTVAGNAVSLGGSTGVAHADLSSISSNDHHAKYTDADAVAAIEAENPLDLAGRIEQVTTSDANDIFNSFIMDDGTTNEFGWKMVDAPNGPALEAHVGGNSEQFYYHAGALQFYFTDDFYTPGADIDDLTVNNSVSGIGHGDLSGVTAGDHHPQIQVSDSGTAVMTQPTDVNFASNLDVTDDADGTVTVDGTDGGPYASGDYVLIATDSAGDTNNLSTTSSTYVDVHTGAREGMRIDYSGLQFPSNTDGNVYLQFNVVWYEGVDEMWWRAYDKTNSTALTGTEMYQGTGSWETDWSPIVQYNDPGSGEVNLIAQIKNGNGADAVYVNANRVVNIYTKMS